MIETNDGIRIVTWNVMQGGGKRIADQIEAMSARRPDIVALQEVVPRTVPAYQAAFNTAGLGHVAVSFAGVEGTVFSGRRRYGTLIASRWPIRPLAYSGIDAPWPERIVSARVTSPDGEVDVHSAYVPIWSHKEPLVKIETMEAIFSRVTASADRPQVLCADLNSPRRELIDGTVITFAQELGRSGQYYVTRSCGLGARRDRAERQLLEGLAEQGILDVFRTVRGYHVQEFSWWHKRTHGYRLDHIFASQCLSARHCTYLHALREERLSDHAPLEAELSWG